MLKSRKKIYRTVVMDGTNQYILGRVHTIQEILSNTKCSFTHYLLDKDHPSIIVMPVEATERQYDKIQAKIEKEYPGLCIFNPSIEC